MEAISIHLFPLKCFPCKTATAKVPKYKIARTKVQVPRWSLPSLRSTLLSWWSSSLHALSTVSTVPQTQTLLSRYKFTLIKIEIQSIKLAKEIREKPNSNLSRSITCYWNGFLGVWSKVVKTKRSYLCTQRWKYKTGHFLRQAPANIQRLWTIAKVQSTLHITFARGKVLGWQTNNTNISYQILIFGVSLLHTICIILFIALRWLEVILGLWSPQNSLDFFCSLILILLFRKIGTGILPHIGRSSLRPPGSCSRLSCFWAWRSFGKKIVLLLLPAQWHQQNYLILVKILLTTP